MKFQILAIPTLFLFFIIAGNTFGQICAGSHLSYIVRDKKGVAIDAKQAGLTFDKSTGIDYTSWSFKDDTFRYEKTEMPQNIKAIFGKTQWLETSRQCNFDKPVKLAVTVKGKVMELTFTLPKMGQYQDADFLVDSVPFKSGKYAITLELLNESGRGFYAASGWKKVE